MFYSEYLRNIEIYMLMGIFLSTLIQKVIVVMGILWYISQTYSCIPLPSGNLR